MSLGIRRLVELARRGWRKPPGVILRWVWRQAAAELDQILAPRRARRLNRRRLLQVLEAASLDALWARLAGAPFPAAIEPVDSGRYDAVCPGDRARILAAAESAISRRVDVLGSGLVDVGRPCDWHRDFKSGRTWPLIPFRHIDILGLGRPSDVKIPWEISRLQWLIPTGQAYVLTGEERYALAAREVILEWAAANPVARGVNWASAMEVALRAFTLVWLFRVFHGAAAWGDASFREEFLRLLFVHGDFTSRHLEWSDVNGNHLLADAAGLVVIGLFLGRGRQPRRWHEQGWDILVSEMPRQVYADGVDFEASAAYQRLVMELFLLPALYRMVLGLGVSEPFRRRLAAMAHFVATYSRTDGSVPLWGDADDGRVLPFGGQDINDHRYLVPLVGLALRDEGLLRLAAGPRPEVFWWFGADAAAKIPADAQQPESRAFAEGGCYVMRGGRDHVFIDCGRVGLGGRGGHGHNDCLSFEAVLLGEPLVTDSGCYVYTASVEWRNRFRSTAFHNTPAIDGEEQNRLVHPEYLWTLRDDAAPVVRRWETRRDRDVFVGGHMGYKRLADPVIPVRSIVLDKTVHGLLVADRFLGERNHRVTVPYHLAAGVNAEPLADRTWRLRARHRDFLLVWQGAPDWTCMLGEGWCSPSYGVKHARLVVEFRLSGPLAPLAVAVLPASTGLDPMAWLDDTVRAIEQASFEKEIDKSPVSRSLSS